MKLYLVTSEEYSHRPTVEVVREAVDAGVDMVQMREKDRSRAECIGLGRELREICRPRNIPFIVNDDPEIAREIDADGVHLGQEDAIKHPFEETRRRLVDKIVGLSTHSLEQVEQANGYDLDYIAYGPVYATQTKEYAVGIAEIESVLKLARMPVFFIGGIKKSNINELKRLGADNFAVITAITKARDIARAVEELRAG